MAEPSKAAYLKEWFCPEQARGKTARNY